MSIISKLEVISEIEKSLELESGQLNENSCAEDFEIWDSVGQLSILVALDNLFSGKIAEISDFAEADSILKILNILQQHALIKN
jgi:hypothetical protein